MQINRVAFFRPQLLLHQFDKHPRIRQVVKLSVIIAQLMDDLPMRILQAYAQLFGNRHRDTFIPLRRIGQKTALGCVYISVVYQQFNVLQTVQFQPERRPWARLSTERPSVFVVQAVNFILVDAGFACKYRPRNQKGCPF
jgi:hypothetical protein